MDVIMYERILGLPNIIDSLSKNFLDKEYSVIF